MENKNVQAIDEKKKKQQTQTISFAVVRNNADLIVSLTNWFSIYIVMYTHDPNILRKSMTTKSMFASVIRELAQ